MGSNDFKAAMDKVDQEYYAEIMNSNDTSEVGSKKRETVKVKDDGTTLDDIEVCMCIHYMTRSVFIPMLTWRFVFVYTMVFTTKTHTDNRDYNSVN